MVRQPSTARVLFYALGRPGVLWPLGLAVALLVMKWPVGAAAVALLAAVRVARLLADPNVSTRARLHRERKLRGVLRSLTYGETTAILAFEGYADDLTAAGADRTLAEQTVERAWAIVKSAGHNDASEALDAFWRSLPQMTPSPPASARDDDLLVRLRREVDIIHATERELERFRP